jgi:AcrR family transcriptional regulator
MAGRSAAVARPSRKGRTPLTRSAILDAALAVVDEEGAAALTFRRVADRLGVDPMAVYYHVPGKAELQDGVAELVLHDLGSVPETGSWVERLRASCTEFRRCVLAHPNAIGLTLTQRTVPQPVLLAAERQLRALDDAGLDGAAADRWYRVLTSYVSGFLATEAAPRDPDGAVLSQDDVERRMAEFTSGHPRLREFSRRMFASNPDQEFALGLDSLLARVETEARQSRKRGATRA